MRLLKFLCIVIALSLPIVTVPYFFASAVRLKGGVDENTVISVYDVSLSQRTEMRLFDYLCGVVAAEMPALYNVEALKAQAVAAFTYFAKRAESGEESEAHAGCAVCTSSSHCSAFINEERQKERWGENYGVYRTKIEEAVRAVYGKVITYGGKAIDALYFARSSGKTESAADVWGNHYDYLTAVNSEVDESGSGFVSEVVMSLSEFEEKFKEKYPNASESGIFTDVARSGSGGVLTAKVLGVTVTGRELRSLYSLNSTNFTVSEQDGNITFTVKGKGHGVGMSQYGANAMAKLGYGWEEIIKHYYTGVEISNYR